VIEDLRKRMAPTQVGKINDPTPIALNDTPQNNLPSQTPPPRQSYRQSSFVEPKFKIDF